MKKITIILSIMLLCTPLYSQMNTNRGVLNNSGKIKIKNRSLNSEGVIQNSGIIEVDEGQATLNQAEIGGTVEFKGNVTQQSIPQISYENLNLKGSGQKSLRTDNRDVVVRSKFYSDSATVFRWDRDLNVKMDVRNEVEHHGKINPAFLHGLVLMNGVSPQNIHGKGRFTRLELDNTAGADVINGGGFKVSSQLKLTRGQMRNTVNSNFIMENESQILRTSEGSLAEKPLFEQSVDIRYEGGSQISTGPEIPLNPNVLRDLEVANNGGLVLNESVTVNRNLTLESDIQTYNTDASNNIITEHELVLTSQENPTFFGGNEEIRGSFTRTNILKNGNQVLFNNRYTFALIPPGGAENVRELTFNVKPGRSYSEVEKTPEEKIKRTMKISAKDAAGNNVDPSTSITVGYGWKHDQNDVNNPNNNETPSQYIDQVEEFKLQRWMLGSWENNESSSVPVATSVNGRTWYVATADVAEFGEFTVGMPDLDQMYFAASAMLEGAYRANNMTMGTELKDRNLIPTTPPNIYPYNLDPNRATLYNVATIPNNVVDWVVIEFRDDALAPTKRFYRTCFIQSDGTLVDINGSTNIRLSEEWAQNMSEEPTKDFYVAIRHRNHLTVLSQEAIFVDVRRSKISYNFSDPSFVYGGSLKAIGVREDNTVVFGAIGGNWSFEPTRNEIVEEDWKASWNRIGQMGYLDEDFDMDGIINTRDYNTSWNNRGKLAPIE